MARALNKLTDTGVRSEKKTGRHSDGGGLYLSVSATGSKSWVFIWTPPGGKRREMGLGSYPAISLAKARKKAVELREAVAEGVDPIARRRKVQEPTFSECVEQFIESMEVSWRNEKHRYQWRQTLGPSYCQGIQDRRISSITSEDVLSILTPIWTEKSETASRLRGRLERLLDYAKSRGWRDGENPARWRGHLVNVLPPRTKLARGHLPAMKYIEVPAFVARLRSAEALAARALELLILTASRPGEVINAPWREFDLDNRIWTVSAGRMKAGREHRVPLTDAAMELLLPLMEARTGDFVFLGQQPGRPLSNMAMSQLLKRMKCREITAHGFRSSFRDWAGDCTSFSREVAEGCLAHIVGNEVERAYRRGDALEKRRGLLDAWASYCGGRASGEVVFIHGKK